MRFQWLGVAAAIAVAACGGPQARTVPPDAVTSSGTGGTMGEFGLKGQVVVSHPPGDRDAVDEVRRQAALRCPSGFTIRSMRSDDMPSNSDFYYRLRTYEAVVDCNRPAPAPGARY